jgi:hypothetical protein
MPPYSRPEKSVSVLESFPLGSTPAPETSAEGPDTSSSAG